MQMQMLQLLDGSEDNPHFCWKQAKPSGQPVNQPGDCDARAPANSFAGGHLSDGKTVCGRVVQRFQGQLRLCA